MNHNEPAGMMSIKINDKLVVGSVQIPIVNSRQIIYPIVDQLFTRREIWDTLRSFKGSTPGKDRIPYALLLNASDDFAFKLTGLFNNIFL